MKILAAVDGSPFTKRMLAWLAVHDEWLGPQHAYTLLTVVPALPPRAAAVLDKALVAEYYEAEAAKVFKPLKPYFSKRGYEVQYLSKVGPVAEAIAKTADKGRFDLLLMGSHGHGSVAGMVLGSVSTKVMAQCGVPVLLVR